MDRVDHLVILGSRVSRIPGNHAMRIQGTANSVISNSQFDTPSTNGNALTIRGKTNAVLSGSIVPWNGTWTENVVVSDNFLDCSVQGGYTLYIGPQSAGHDERHRNIITERNRVVGGASYAAYFHVSENLTVRNNIFSSMYSYSMAINGQSNLAALPVTTS